MLSWLINVIFGKPDVTDFVNDRPGNDLGTCLKTFGLRHPCLYKFYETFLWNIELYNYSLSPLSQVIILFKTFESRAITSCLNKWRFEKVSDTLYLRLMFTNSLFIMHVVKYLNSLISGNRHPNTRWFTEVFCDDSTNKFYVKVSNYKDWSLSVPTFQECLSRLEERGPFWIYINRFFRVGVSRLTLR